MKKLVIALTSTLLAGTALAERAPQPDFVAVKQSVDRTHAASDATREVEPFEVVPFGTDSVEMESIDRTQLTEAVQWLRTHPGYRLVVEGHADATGSTTYNDQLARTRAMVVRGALIQLGASKDRVVTASFGEQFSNQRIGGAQRAAIVYAQRKAK